MSQLVDRLVAVESKLDQAEKISSASRLDTTQQHVIDNVLARLTLLENEFKLVKAQVAVRDRHLPNQFENEMI